MQRQGEQDSSVNNPIRSEHLLVWLFSTDPQISMMRAFTQKGAAQKPVIAPVHNQAACPAATQYVPSLLGFLSDFSSDEDDGDSNTNMDHSDDRDGTSRVSSALPRKRQKLEVPYHEQRKQSKLQSKLTWSTRTKISRSI
jgi:hypothetical protein